MTQQSETEAKTAPSPDTTGAQNIHFEPTDAKHFRWPWARLTYTTRVTATFALIAAMTALVALGVLSFVWEQHFQTYTQENMTSLAESTAARIEKVYKEKGTLYDQEVIQIAQYAESMSSGVGILISDNLDHRIVYDSAAVKVQDETANTGKTLAPPANADGIETSPIVVDGIAVGSVRVWVYGSEALLTRSDEEFRDNSYQAMIFAAMLAIILASCIGFLFARALVSPINRMTTTAKAIKEGDLSARTNLHGDDEIARLGETFDEMADSVEKDRDLERRLTTDVAHELRTPLMAIQSTVEAMVDGVFEADEERLETVNSEVQRLSRLVDAILKLSRLENRSTPIKMEVVDVGQLLESIVATHEAFVADLGLTLSYEMEPDVRVLGDVRVYALDTMAAIQVADTGIGLSPEEAKMVFSRFWRADAGRTRESGGLGIGLSVVKEIVDRHNGWVQVEGVKNKGACFTIHIPLYQDDVLRNLKSHKSRGKSRKDTK